MTVKARGLYAKLAEVMGEVGRVEKRGRNDFHKYDYVTEADLLDAVRLKLAERGVVVLPSLVGDVDEREVTTSKGGTSTISTVRMRFKLVDSETGEADTVEFAGQGEDPADKGVYKGYTGAQKYFLMKTFLIPTGDDPEADSRTDQRASERQSSSRKSSSGAAANEKQLKYLKSLVARSGVLVPQLEQMLRDAGADPEVKEGWASALSSRQVSALIDRLKDGNLPPAPDPVPAGSDAGDDELFTHPSAGVQGTPWEKAP